MTSLLRFQVFGSLSYEISSPATIIAALHGMQTPGQTVYNELFTINRDASWELLSSGPGGNRFARIRIDSSGPTTLSYSADVLINVLRVPQRELPPLRPDQLSADVIPYLFPSRYCQSDMFRTEAANLVNPDDSPYEQVLTIVQWLSENIQYVSGSTNEQSSAIDVMEQREGVCRDFAHLGITLCRALTIPARYTTVYAYQLEPQDFHACFEVNIGGQWLLFDATGLAPLNGMIRISTGRDASDTAVASLFGNIQGTGLLVDCQSLDENFTPITRQSLHESDAAHILP